MSQTNDYNLPLLEAVCRRGVLCNVSVRYWRGSKKLRPEDLGFDPAHVSDGLIQLGHKRRVPREARLMALAIHFDRLIRDGAVGSYSGLARLAGTSPPWITAIMKLVDLPVPEQEGFLSTKKPLNSADRAFRLRARQKPLPTGPDLTPTHRHTR